MWCFPLAVDTLPPLRPTAPPSQNKIVKTIKNQDISNTVTRMSSTSYVAFFECTRGYWCQVHGPWSVVVADRGFSGQDPPWLREMANIRFCQISQKKKKMHGIETILVSWFCNPQIRHCAVSTTDYLRKQSWFH